MFQKDTKITASELTSLISLINSEISRRGINSSQHVTPPAANTIVDDTVLDVLGNSVAQINAAHCFCQTNVTSPLVIDRNGGTALSITSQPVDAGEILYSSKAEKPDIGDIVFDVTALTAQFPCSPQCDCVSVCPCEAQYLTTCGTYRVCTCQSVCSCQNDCSCDCNNACSCNCNDNPCPCNLEEICFCEDMDNCYFG